MQQRGRFGLSRRPELHWIQDWPFQSLSRADLIRLPAAFDHDDFIFELKVDGFRALAFVDEGETRLVSRKGNVYKRFVELSTAIHLDLDCEAVFDGEIAAIDDAGPAAVLRASPRGEL